MENQELLKTVKERAQVWLSEQYDEATRAEVKQMLEAEDPTPLIEAFYRDLEFGTGGLRGIMGPGTNRMNIYTVGAATQGLANYLKEAFADLDQISVAVGHDVRNNSRKFAEIVANIFSANGIKAYLFDSFRPTPELSFAIRELGCQSGVNITASHNPKEYNGYKAYWADGAQIIAPHDVNIINHVNAIKSVGDIKFQGNPELIEIIGEEIDNKFLAAIKELSLSPDVIERHKDLKIVYTPIHGTGVKLVPDSLRNYGFTNIIHVPEQDIPSGDFPTVESPNPRTPLRWPWLWPRQKRLRPTSLSLPTRRRPHRLRHPRHRWRVCAGQRQPDCAGAPQLPDDPQRRAGQAHRQRVCGKDNRHHRDHQAHRRRQQHQDV